jgi:hypothetical protein
MSLRKIISAIIVVSSISLLSPIIVAAQTSSNTPSDFYGPWVVHQLSLSRVSSGAIESYKVDRDLVVWTEVNEYFGRRYLNVWNGSSSERLASMNMNDWRSRSDFYDPVTGQYDVSDGVVVWSQYDGLDLEIMVYRNNQIEQLTRNGQDDEHPVTSNGRIAWTSQQSQVYKLMVTDNYGLRPVAEYHVMNYAFSGDNLYWLNLDRRLNQFHAFCNTGSNQTNILSEAEVRPLRYNYFLVNDRGGAVWEVLRTDIGSFGMQLVYSSNDGYFSREIFRRQRWSYDLQLEDLRDDGTILINAHDTSTKNIDDTSLMHTSGNWEATVTIKSTPVRARSISNAFVRHETPETSSPLIVRYDDGYQDFVSQERVRHNLFVADGDVIAAAKHENGGLLLYNNRQLTIIPTPRDVRSIITRGNTTAWIYEDSRGVSRLAVASRAILVGNSAGAKFVSGHLVKSADNSSVYLATPAGERYIFPAESQFYSWYENFDSLQTISARDLAAMQLTGSVLYPTRTLIKTPSSPKVYTVGADGQLYWVTDGSVLAVLYGQNWNRLVHDLSESFITSYRFGRSVLNSNDYYSIALTR